MGKSWKKAIRKWTKIINRITTIRIRRNEITRRINVRIIKNVIRRRINDLTTITTIKLNRLIKIIRITARIVITTSIIIILRGLTLKLHGRWWTINDEWYFIYKLDSN